VSRLKEKRLSLGRSLRPLQRCSHGFRKLVKEGGGLPRKVHVKGIYRVACTYSRTPVETRVSGLKGKRWEAQRKPPSSLLLSCTATGGNERQGGKTGTGGTPRKAGLCIHTFKPRIFRLEWDYSRRPRVRSKESRRGLRTSFLRRARRNKTGGRELVSRGGGKGTLRRDFRFTERARGSLKGMRGTMVRQRKRA